MRERIVEPAFTSWRVAVWCAKRIANIEGKGASMLRAKREGSHLMKAWALIAWQLACEKEKTVGEALAQSCSIGPNAARLVPLIAEGWLARARVRMARNA